MKVNFVKGCKVLYNAKVLLGDYQALYDDFKADGVVLCHPNVAVREKASSEFLALLSDHKLRINYTDKGIEHEVLYTYKKGFVTDLASTPKITRWFIDNDDGKIIRSALGHDGNFVGHYLDGSGGRAKSLKKGFRTANRLFKGMMIYDGMNRFIATLAYTGVSSIFGFRRYEEVSEFEQYNIENFVEVKFIK